MQFFEKKNFLNLIVVAWNNNKYTLSQRALIVVWLYSIHILNGVVHTIEQPPPLPLLYSTQQWRRKCTSTLCAHGFCECGARFIVFFSLRDIPQVPTTVHRFFFSSIHYDYYYYYILSCVGVVVHFVRVVTVLVFFSFFTVVIYFFAANWFTSAVRCLSQFRVFTSTWGQ